MSRYRWAAFPLILVLQAALLYFFGQPLIAESGRVLLWAGEPLSPDNSQQLADWYTFSHIIHGILFYWVLGKIFPKLSIVARALLALGVEVAWELIENTPWLIEHYRQQALAQGYTGDSILNSISDSLAMLLGFLAARKLPVLAVVMLAVVLEGASLYFIRDGLLLNAVNLLHPFDFVSAWQASG